MALNFASFNAMRLRDPSNWAHACLVILSKLSGDVSALQETNFTCAADCRLLEDDYVILSAYGNRSSVGASLLIIRSLNADVNLFLLVDGGRPVVTDVAVKSFEFRVAAVYAPYSFFSVVNTVPRRSKTDSFSG